ncbi:hypothetical protein [Lysobacter gummosus]|uniref:hypothetical protein n=1 Tax=Lysobacter gummosus TaxID=262324 RepID=UPI003641B407
MRDRARLSDLRGVDAKPGRRMAPRLFSVRPWRFPIDPAAQCDAASSASARPPKMIRAWR